MPAKPTVSIIDLDYLIYSASSIAEKITYTYSDKKGNEVASFGSASEGKAWIDTIKAFGGIDPDYGYEGDVEDLIRSTSYKPVGLGKAQKNFDRMLKEWLLEAGTNEWRGYCSALKGMKLFRHDIATIQPYKGNRKGVHKPHYLDDIRRYALSYNNVKRVGGGIECDDKVCSVAQAIGEKAVLQACDKDILTCVGTWLKLPDEEMVWSDPNIVGKVWIEKKGTVTKVRGFGLLYLLSMCITGDQADSYGGCPKAGPVVAVDVLSPFNGMPRNMLHKAVEATCELFKQKVGDSYTYTHCHIGEPVTVTWKEVLVENLLLAYMVKHKGDAPTEILQHIERI